MKCLLTVTNIYTWQPYLFCHSCDHLCISSLEDVLFKFIYTNLFKFVHTCVSIHNANAYDVLSDSQVYYICHHTCSFNTYDCLSVPCLTYIVNFLPFMPITFEIIHIWFFTEWSHIRSVSDNYRYFIFASYICSFTYSYIHDSMHVCMYVCLYIHILQSYIHCICTSKNILTCICTYTYKYFIHMQVCMPT